MLEKKLIISNIDYLLKLNNKKIGELEQKAQVTLGYLSRLRKEDNISNPSLDFLVHASEYLGVSIDTLINQDLKKLSSNDLQIKKFIENLTKNTVNFKTRWVKEHVNDLCNYSNDHNIYHPLFKRFCKSDSFYDDLYFLKYNSVVHPDIEYTPIDFIYHTSIVGATIYISKILSGDPFSFESNELYLVKDDQVIFLGLWAENEENILGDDVHYLYNAIENAIDHPFLSVDILNIIDRYNSENLDQEILENENNNNI